MAPETRAWEERVRADAARRWGGGAATGGGGGGGNTRPGTTTRAVRGSLARVLVASLVPMLGVPAALYWYFGQRDVSAATTTRREYMRMNRERRERLSRAGAGLPQLATERDIGRLGERIMVLEREVRLGKWRRDAERAFQTAAVVASLVGPPTTTQPPPGQKEEDDDAYRPLPVAALGTISRGLYSEEKRLEALKAYHTIAGPPLPRRDLRLRNRWFGKRRVMGRYKDYLW